MSWLHGCWGVGASISPFIMGHALSRDLGWPRGHLVAGLLQAAMTAILIVAIPLWRKVNPTKPPASRAEEAGDAPKQTTHAVPLKVALGLPGVKLMLLAFFGYCAFEATAMLWASTYLAQHRGVDTATAARFGALFVVGVTLSGCGSSPSTCCCSPPWSWE
ncbi:MAG: MFS transporter [Propionibacteriaceae bacterium]|jgi:fucose permease|nr:MFS transporter [Propionibacteriaceae bacterium]